MSADAPKPGPQSPAPKPAGSPLAGLVIPLLLIAAAGVVFAVFYFLNQKPPSPNPNDALNGYVIGAEKYAKLADRYTDADGDLVADIPADAKEPDELFFTEIPGRDLDASENTWAAFLEHMSKVTGKPCKYLKKVVVPASPDEPREGDRPGDNSGAAGGGEVTSYDAQLAALKNGQLHITAFTTGQVREAVNTAGFRPLVVPATTDDKYFYQIEVVVRADSPIQKVGDLKGKTLAVSALSSNSGAKAPFVLFHDGESKLNPRTDYKISLTGTYWAALAQVLRKEADATCIAGDLLARELARGEPTDAEAKRGRMKVTEEKIRRIYTSGDYPKLCFGVSNTLPKPLADKVLEGFKTFAFAGTAVGEKYKPDGAVKFLPIDYKKDWESVRAIDDRLVEILKGP